MNQKEDPRWLQLSGPGVDCSCGQRHVGLIDLVFLKPADWPDAPANEPSADLRMDGNFLSDDYAVRDGKFFALRVALPLPVKDISPPASALAVWASVERADFEKYVAAPKVMMANPPARFVARLITRIGGYPDTLGLMGYAFPQEDGMPLFVLGQPPAGPAGVHQLYTEHREGVTLDRLFEVYAAQDHDMRAGFAGPTQ